MDYNGSNGTYRQQQPLRPPPMMPASSIQASVSPRFDNIMTHSNPIPWSPAPLDGHQYDKPLVDPLSTNHPYTKSSERWSNNNSLVKSSDVWTNNNAFTKSDVWPNNNAPPKRTDLWSPNNTVTKPADSTMASNNSSNAQMIKSSDKKSGFLTDKCSPRCKLGILGFTIGFLTVGIALAVILVLWLKQ